MWPFLLSKGAFVSGSLEGKVDIEFDISAGEPAKLFEVLTGFFAFKRKFRMVLSKNRYILEKIEEEIYEILRVFEKKQGFPTSLSERKISGE